MNWIGDTSDHPVISQSLYRIKDHRLEQIGSAWVKHGYGALQNPGCGCTCIPDDFQHLGVGCADPYSAGINGSQTRLGPRREVNPRTGVFPFPPTGWGQTGGVLERRLRVPIADVVPELNPESMYLVEAQYVTPAEAPFGNDGNNVSWRACEFVPGQWTDYYDMELMGETQIGFSAVEAWASIDPEVRASRIDVPGDGMIIVGSRVTEVRDGWYRYTWAVQNVSCDREISGLRMGIQAGSIVSATDFHDVELHGSGVDRAPWSFVQGDSQVEWSTESHDVNPDANSIRWGTTFTYTLETNSPPIEGSIQFDLFKPGDATTFNATATVPGDTDFDPCDFGVGPCPWELDGAPGINGGDLAMLLGGWGICGDGTFRPHGDINGDCCVNGSDLAELLVAWGYDCTPVGACCFGNGTCVDMMNEETCLQLNGVYLGEGTECANATCPEGGACCLPDGSCVDHVFAWNCVTLSGIYSPFSTCDDVGCLLGSDDCKGALPIEDGVHLYSTLSATTGGPGHLECKTGNDGGEVGNDIWFTYQPIADGLLHLSTCNSVDYDSELLVYAGDDCADLVLVGCNDDVQGCNGYSSELTVEVDLGTSYIIRVGGWRDGSSGSGQLLVELITE